MTHEDFHDEPDEGVEPLGEEDEEAGVEPLEPGEEDDLLLEELEDEEGFGGAP